MNFKDIRPPSSEYAHLSMREKSLFSSRMMFSQIWFELWNVPRLELVIEVSPTTVVFIKDIFDQTGTPLLSFSIINSDEDGVEAEVDEGVTVHQISYALTSFPPEMRHWSVKNIGWISGEITDKITPCEVKTLVESSAKELESLLAQITEAISPERTAHD